MSHAWSESSKTLTGGRRGVGNGSGGDWRVWVVLKGLVASLSTATPIPHHPTPTIASNAKAPSSYSAWEPGPPPPQDHWHGARLCAWSTEVMKWFLSSHRGICRGGCGEGQLRLMATAPQPATPPPRRPLSSPKENAVYHSTVKKCVLNWGACAFHCFRGIYG